MDAPKQHGYRRNREINRIHFSHDFYNLLHNNINRKSFFDYMELETVRDSIEKFNTFNQIEVLRILKSHSDVVLNENKNGVYINLADVNQHAIQQLVDFIRYVSEQEASLDATEKQKEEFKNAFFS